MFEHNGLIIRPIEKSDLPFLLELRSYQSVWNNLGDVLMLTTKKQEKWFDYISYSNSKQYYIASKDNVDVGIIRTDEIDYLNRSMRVGCDIHPDYQRKGHGSNVMELIKIYAFNYLNMNRVWLSVLETNKIAISMYRKHGFLVEGIQRGAIFRNGVYVDYLMMSILRREYAGLSGN